MAKTPEPFSPTAPGVFDVAGAATFCGLTVAYLHNLRHHQKGPKFTKSRGRVYYKEADLTAWNTARLGKKASRGAPKKQTLKKAA